jgi:hypothetical protein
MFAAPTPAMMHAEATGPTTGTSAMTTAPTTEHTLSQMVFDLYQGFVALLFVTTI